MSGAASITIGGPSPLLRRDAGGLALDVGFRGADVVAMLGYLPAAVVGALGVHAFDLVDHHRRKVGSNAQKNFPNGSKARRYWFMKSFAYGHKALNTIGDIAGRSVAFSSDGEAGAMSLLERGGNVAAREPFFIPFSQGPFPAARLRKMFDEGKTRGMIRITHEGVVFWGVHNPKSRRKGLASMLDSGGGLAGVGVAIGLVRRRRSARPLLGFDEALKEIMPAHEKNLNKVFDQAFTAADQQALAESTQKLLGRVTERAARNNPKWTRRPAAEKAAQAAAARLASADRLSPAIDITPGRGGAA